MNQMRQAGDWHCIVKSLLCFRWQCAENKRSGALTLASNNTHQYAQVIALSMSYCRCQHCCCCWFFFFFPFGFRLTFLCSIYFDIFYHIICVRVNAQSLLKLYRELKSKSWITINKNRVQGQSMKCFKSPCDCSNELKEFLFLFQLSLSLSFCVCHYYYYIIL